MPLPPLDPKACEFRALQDDTGQDLDLLLVYNDNGRKYVARSWSRPDQADRNSLKEDPIADEVVASTRFDEDQIASVKHQIQWSLTFP